MSQIKSQKMGFLDLVWYYKYWFAFYIICTSTLTFAGLYIIGGVPDELKLVSADSLPTQSITTPASVTIPTTQNTSAQNDIVQGELPEKVIINKIGINATVSNPDSTDNDVLNQYLLHGAVRYPGSGTLGHGNVFIFGHSTGIKIVNNQAYKTFNNLKGMNIGDDIEVESATKTYVYKVVSVTLIDSDQQWVDLTSTQDMLTLSTCDVFGQKQQRFVVQAMFDHTTPL